MAPWTAAGIPDQTGRTVVVTGSNRGIGLQAAFELARHGAYTVVATRRAGNAEAAAEHIRRRAPGALVEPMRLDLADLDSVREFAARFRATHDRLDLLINNAGVGYLPYGRTADGFEATLGTNHFGHFALTGLLLDLLLDRPGARVVTVASRVHEHPEACLDFDDLLFERHYDPATAYARSKLANLLFAHELHRRLAAAGVALRSVGTSPRLTATQFGPPEPAQRLALLRSLGSDAQSIPAGTTPILYAATAPGVRGGDYVQPVRRGGPPVTRPAAPAAYDVVAAQRLWAISEKTTGVCYQVVPAAWRSLAGVSGRSGEDRPAEGLCRSPAGPDNGHVDPTGHRTGHT
jgi:NAD(P)-dependent dehydrogenase (short-subunit alcohol dehydrogenase family)